MMDELDDALKSWGAAWRARQDPPPHEVPIGPRDLAPRTSSRAWPVLLAVVTIVGGAWLAPRLLTSQTGNGPAKLQAGDLVIGAGAVVEEPTRDVFLCMLRGGRLPSPAPAPGCSVVRVPLVGLDLEAVPGIAIVDGVRFAPLVTIRGTWNGDAVVVETIAEGGLPEAEIPNPCASSEGSGNGLGSLDEEEALGRLGAEVFGNPTVYGGLWRASSSDGLGRVVVGVKGDTAPGTAKLRALYPYPLCVVAVAFSEADLDVTLRALREEADLWIADVDLPRNRVAVSVGVVTNLLLTRLGPHADRVVVDELVRKR